MGLLELCPTKVKISNKTQLFAGGCSVRLYDWEVLNNVVLIKAKRKVYIS
jgi:hypothetical protein